MLRYLPVAVLLAIAMLGQNELNGAKPKCQVGQTLSTKWTTITAE
jgi:hypothetical protein